MERIPVKIRILGVREYVQCWREMQRFTDHRGPDTFDEIWLLEHPSVYTQGVSGKSEHVLDSGGIPVVQSDRGGQITYHGPGQLVLYPLLDIRRRKLEIRRLISLLEMSAIDILKQYGIRSYAQPKAPGVYVDQRKIASVGIRVRRGCCYHGMSVNVNVDLRPFSGINICGFPSLEATCISDLGGPRAWHEVAIPLTHRFLNYLNSEWDQKWQNSQGA